MTEPTPEPDPTADLVAALEARLRAAQAGGPYVGPGTYVPGPDTTGIPPLTWLKPHPGDLRITTPGWYDSLDISGCLDIRASNVRVTRSIVRGGAAPVYGTQHALVRCWTDGVTGVVLEDLLLEPSHPSVDVYGINGGGWTGRRLQVVGAVDGAVMHKASARLEASWLRGSPHYAVDPRKPDGSHNDGVQVEGGDKHAVVGCRIEGYHNAAIMVTQNVALTTNLLIERNHLSGGGVSLNVAEKGRGPLTGLRVLHNTWGRDQRHYPRVALIPATTRAVAVEVGNVHDDGTPALIGNG